MVNRWRWMPATIVEGRTVVPLRFSEAFAAGWSGGHQQGIKFVPAVAYDPDCSMLYVAQRRAVGQTYLVFRTGSYVRQYGFGGRIGARLVQLGQ